VERFEFFEKDITSIKTCNPFYKYLTRTQRRHTGRVAQAVAVEQRMRTFNRVYGLRHFKQPSLSVTDV
jgi:hypothetical protein